MITAETRFASNWSYKSEKLKEFQNIEDMVKWGLKQHRRIIIENPYEDDVGKIDYMLTIYDDWIE